MIEDSEISVNAGVTNGNARLQTEVSETTKSYLRIESIRRGVTMGQLLNLMVELFCKNDVSQTNS